MVDRRMDDARSLTAAGLNRLLARLDADADRAAAEYERLRRALIKFFDWRGASAPDECADETIDRLARRLEETSVDDVRSYARGIARLVLLERQRRPAESSLDGDVAVPSVAARPAPPADEGLHDCFDRCLETFDANTRSLMLRYY